MAALRVTLVAAVAAGLGLVASIAGPGPVAAHALLRESSPASGASVGIPPDVVTLTFSETPDPALTSVKVLDSGGTDHAAGPPVADAGTATTVSVPLQAMADGVYTVSWRTVSAVDGHISAGSFSFGVGVAAPSGPPESGAGTGQAGSMGAVIARLVLYLGLLLLLGAAFVAVAVVRAPAPDLLALAAVAWLATALGTAGVVAVQWLDTGAPLETLLGTSVATTGLARGAALLVLALAVVWLALARGSRATVRWSLVGLAAAAATVVDVAAGHAAAGDAPMAQVLIQSTHGLAAGAWLGGLASLLVALRTTPEAQRLETARRYSTWAAVSLGLVAATGAVRAIGEVGSIDALVSTDFGRVVIAKSVLLVLIASLGALNRFVNLRNAARAIAGLRRAGSAELILAAVVVALSGLLVNLIPPTSAGGSTTTPPPPIVALGSDFGTSVRARLFVAPGTPGESEFQLTIADFDTSEPIAASAAELRFELLSQAGVSPSTLDLKPTAGEPGAFDATGTNLAIDGIWRITATLTLPGGAVEVPLVAATSITPQPTQSLVSPGLPTIYTIQLGDVGSAQVYLDPGQPGQNELHVTYFDPAGTELPLEAATVLVTPASGPGAVPDARLLEPGHFVASVDAPAEALTVDVISPLSVLPAAAGSGHVHLRVTIEVQP